MGSEAGVRMQCSGDQVGSAASMSWWKSLLVRKEGEYFSGPGCADLDCGWERVEEDLLAKFGGEVC